MTTNQGPPMKRPRSPNYPTVGLREAVERVGRLYEKDNKAGAPPEMAAVHIGFGKPHGQAMSVLAALKKFGLVTKTNGRIVPTQRAIEIINLPETDPRRQKALRDAAMEPEIYRELIDQHRESGWPSEEVLSSELVTYKSFIKRAADGLVRSLLDSIEFAGLSDASALESEEEAETDVLETTIDTHAKAASAPFAGQQTADKTGLAKASVRSYSFALSPDAKADLIFHGEITEESLTALRDYIDITVRVLAGLKKKPEPGT